MSCCQCQGIERLFDQRTAARELKNYQQQGPEKSTRLLLDTLRQGLSAAQPFSLLDIGGGVGVIQHELMGTGLAQGTSIDASSAYLSLAKQEAERRGYAERMHYQHGNFVDIAPCLEPADIVTLDRVICCYDDMPSLVKLSAEKAQRFYGLVFPRDTWWMKIGRILVEGTARSNNVGLVIGLRRSLIQSPLEPVAGGLVSLTTVPAVAARLKMLVRPRTNRGCFMFGMDG